MKIASHNSWTFLKPKSWWMYLIRRIAKCQEVDIKTQYNEYNVRLFDLRILFNLDGYPEITHGFVKYRCSIADLYNYFEWLNKKGDTAVRILLDTRSKQSYDLYQRTMFRNWCSSLEYTFNNIKFCGGRNLYNWNIDYVFKNKPAIQEKHTSVQTKKWLPYLFLKHRAKIHNPYWRMQGTEADYLMLDYVNY